VSTSQDILIVPSLVLYGAPAYLAIMIWRKVVSGVLTLMAVQYAALGAGSVCTADHAGAVTGAATHAAHEGTRPAGPMTPCAPGSQQPPRSHSPAGCLAMASCTACGVVSVDSQKMVLAAVSAARPARTISSLHSIRSAPETPPPIA